MSSKPRIPYSERRSMKFLPEEIQAIKDYMDGSETISRAAIEIGIERTVLCNLVFRGTGAEKTVKQVRKFLRKQKSLQ